MKVLKDLIKVKKHHCRVVTFLVSIASLTTFNTCRAAAAPFWHAFDNLGRSVLPIYEALYLKILMNKLFH